MFIPGVRNFLFTTLGAIILGELLFKEIRYGPFKRYVTLQGGRGEESVTVPSFLYYEMIKKCDIGRGVKI